MLVATGLIGAMAMPNANFNATFNRNLNNPNTTFGMMYAKEAGPISGERLSAEALNERVEAYILSLDPNLRIADVFVFEDTETYYSILEENTGRGALELLVNPVTGAIMPEYGPNMMWNLKYGMHQKGYNMMSDTNGSFHMMGSKNSSYNRMMNGPVSDFNGWMRGVNTQGQTTSNTTIAPLVSSEEAANLALEYVKQSIDKNGTIEEEGHEFYGYTTYHIMLENNVIGMLSVNTMTGQVWYHHWHGTVVEVLEGHKE